MSPQAGQMLLHEIAPRLHRTVLQRVAMFGSEDAEELHQDALAMAANSLDSVEKRGKTVTPGNIAFYTGQALRSGRGSTSSCHADALSSGARLKGYSSVHSLDESFGDGEEPLTLADLLTSDAEGPSVAAARNLDWEAFLASADERQQAVIHTLAEKRQLQVAARAHGVSPSCFSAVKQHLAQDAVAFWGPSVLAQVLQEPGWRDGIRAGQERHACRWERNGMSAG